MYDSSYCLQTAGNGLVCLRAAVCRTHGEVVPPRMDREEAEKKHESVCNPLDVYG